MNLFLTLCTLLGFGMSYDGQLKNKYFFQVNTPNVDYGFVVQVEPEIKVYQDMIHYKYRPMR